MMVSMSTSSARVAPASLSQRRARANGRAVALTPSGKSSTVVRTARMPSTTVASATKTAHSYAHTNRKGLSAYVERAATKQTKRDLIPFRVGMTLKVGVTVKEGNKTRVQPYEGVVIAIHRAGVATTVTVRKTSQGFGVERVFPVHSPLCTFEEIRGAGKPVVRIWIFSRVCVRDSWFVCARAMTT
jgi:large subunit ribosomal protein L19